MFSRNLERHGQVINRLFIMPKRKGYIIEKIADMDNLLLAAKESQKGGKAKRSIYIQRFNEKKEERLEELRNMILDLNFPPPNYRVRKRVVDCGKTRDIVLSDYFPWHVLDHAIIQVIGDDIVKPLITDTCACIKGKGLTYGARRVKKSMRLNAAQYPFFVKTDFKRFYESIPHDRLLDKIKRTYKDGKFIELVDRYVLNYNSDVLNLLDEEYKKRIANRTLHFSAAG